MSASVNKVLLVGNLGADPEIRYSPNGTPVARFSVATSERRRQADGSAIEHVEWHRVSVFGSLAENARDFLRKGSQVYLEGRIKTDSWRDREGQERKMVVIQGTRLLKLGRKEDSPEQTAPAPEAMNWLNNPAPVKPSTLASPLDEEEYPF